MLANDLADRVKQLSAAEIIRGSLDIETTEYCRIHGVWTQFDANIYPTVSTAEEENYTLIYSAFYLSR